VGKENGRLLDDAHISESRYGAPGLVSDAQHARTPGLVSDTRHTRHPAWSRGEIAFQDGDQEWCQIKWSVGASDLERLWFVAAEWLSQGGQGQRVRAARHLLVRQ
jgi:hypothetical protein